MVREVSDRNSASVPAPSHLSSAHHTARCHTSSNVMPRVAGSLPALQSMLLSTPTSWVGLAPPKVFFIKFILFLNSLMRESAQQCCEVEKVNWEAGNLSSPPESATFMCASGGSSAPKLHGCSERFKPYQYCLEINSSHRWISADMPLPLVRKASYTFQATCHNGDNSK